MNDLISRADAIALLTKIVFDEPPYFDSETLCRKYAEEQINTLPSAEAVSREDYHNLLTATNDIDRALREYQAKEESESSEAVQGWIPCSERLPDVDVEVLATVDWSDVLIVWLIKGGAWETEDYILDHDEIIAWMPLPKPYKGGGDE